jgi:hypothetical protein
MSPVLFHLSEKIGAVCLTRVALSCPLLSQIRARPSYEPVASVLPSGLQSNVVTSLTEELGEECLRTTELREASEAALRPERPSGTRQILAVSSPEPEASSEVTGLNEHMNTSEVWPSKTDTRSGLISIPVSTSSIGSEKSLLLFSSRFTVFDPGLGVVDLGSNGTDALILDALMVVLADASGTVPFGLHL